MAKGKEPSFEEALTTLEGLIERIESPEVGLEEAIQQYEEGAALVKRCRAILDRAEVRIAELTERGVESGGSDAGGQDDGVGAEA